MSLQCEIKNKTAVISGGAGGIGYAIADNFLKNGAGKIIILDLNPKLGQEAAEKLNSKYGKDKAVFVECDVTKDLDEEFQVLIDSYKNIEVLVNSAGVIAESDFKKCVDINLTSLIGWSLKFWNYARKDRNGNGGTIINIASIYGYRTWNNGPVYAATKFGVYGFSKSLGDAFNYDRTKVRVVALCPGFTKSNLLNFKDGAFLDKEMEDNHKKYISNVSIQDTDVVGKAAVEVFEKSESGKAWLIEDGKPIEEV